MYLSTIVLSLEIPVTILHGSIWINFNYYHLLGVHTLQHMHHIIISQQRWIYKRLSKDTATAYWNDQKNDYMKLNSTTTAIGMKYEKFRS